MISELTFQRIARSFPNTEEAPHRDRVSYKITGRRIFATQHTPSHSANLKLSLSDQVLYSETSESIYPIPNKWGQQGWTTFELNSCDEDLIKSALESAYLHNSKK